MWRGSGKCTLSSRKTCLAHGRKIIQCKGVLSLYDHSPLKGRSREGTRYRSPIIPLESHCQEVGGDFWRPRCGAEMSSCWSLGSMEFGAATCYPDGEKALQREPCWISLLLSSLLGTGLCVSPTLLFSVMRIFFFVFNNFLSESRVVLWNWHLFSCHLLAKALLFQ